MFPKLFLLERNWIVRPNLPIKVHSSIFSAIELNETKNGSLIE